MDDTTMVRPSHTIDDITNFNPRKEQNMGYNDKVTTWLEKLFIPEYRAQAIPGEGVQYTLSQPYPPTVSDTLSHYSSEQGEEEYNWRRATKAVLRAYRREPEQVKPGIRPTGEPKTSIAIEISPVSLRPTPKKKGIDSKVICKNNSPQGRRNKPSSGGTAPHRYNHHHRRHNRNYPKPEQVVGYYNRRYNDSSK